MYKISLVIPVYNAEKTLTNTLESAVSQTLSELEIICVDDGSNDGSAKMIKKWQQLHSNIHYIYQNNQGAGAARNHGIALAKGEYIAFIDADDSYPDRYALEKLYRTAHDHAACVCGGSAITDGSVRLDTKAVFQKKGYLHFENYQYDFLFGRFIFQREFLLQNAIVFPELSIYEDPVFLAHALIVSKKFYAIPDPVYCYHGAHQVYTMGPEKVRDYLNGICMELQLSSDMHLSDLHRRVFHRLEKEACYYAEPLLYTEDKNILLLLFQAQKAIDHTLIALDPDYLLPPFWALWRAARYYMRFCQIPAVRYGISLIRKIKAGRNRDECQKKYF